MILKNSFFVLLFLLILAAAFLGTKFQKVEHIDGTPQIVKLQNEVTTLNAKFNNLALEKISLEKRHAVCSRSIDSLNNESSRSNAVHTNNSVLLRQHAEYEENLRKHITVLEDSLKIAYGVIWEKEQSLLKKLRTDSTVTPENIRPHILDIRIRDLIAKEDSFVAVFITHITSKTYSEIQNGHCSEHLSMIKTLNKMRRNLSGWRVNNENHSYQDDLTKNNFMGKYWYNVDGKYRLAFLVLNYLDDIDRPTLPKEWFKGTFTELQYHFYHSELLPDFSYEYRDHALINIKLFTNIHRDNLDNL